MQEKAKKLGFKDAWRLAVGNAKERLKILNKRGNAGLNFFKGFMITLFVVIVIVFALAIMGANLSASTTDTTALAIIQNFSSALLTLGSSIPTWITMAGLVVLITLIVVVIMVVNRMDGNNSGGI